MRESSPQVVTPGPDPSEQLVGDKRWELANRVASSTPFKKSPRLRQFLLFVAEQAVTGHAGDISEYEIGWKVFERGPDYNPVDDSIVRSAARQLRAKVKEYFDTEGIHESTIIDIPKGAYVPVFIEREHAAALPHHVELPLADVHAGATVRNWQLTSAALAIALVLLAGYELWRSSAPTAVKQAATIASTVLSADQPTQVVLGDFGMAYVSAATKHPLTLSEYANRSYPAPIPPKDMTAPLQQIWGGLLSGQMTSFNEANIAASILRLGGEEGKRATLEHSRQITARDFRSGNSIVIASPLASPWIYLFEDKLNFRYQIRYDHSFAGTPEFVNAHPKPGEKSVYAADALNPQSGTSYAVLARVPNLTGTGKVLLIYGFRTSGATAAGEFATDPRAASELAKLFHVDSVQDVPDFEVLLETSAMANTPLNVHIAAHRRIQ